MLESIDILVPVRKPWFSSPVMVVPVTTLLYTYNGDSDYYYFINTAARWLKEGGTGFDGVRRQNHLVKPIKVLTLI